MIGARGLGQEVLLAINRIDVGRGFEAGSSVVLLAIVIDRITQSLARRWEPPTR
jgi:glycine betaine/proline transport system permease protein